MKISGRRFRKALAVYLAVEVAIHDTLSLVAGVTALMTGATLVGGLLVGWAVTEVLLKGLAAWALAHDAAPEADSAYTAPDGP